jgi:tripartite-type tricarboxylate transporter receptor subunit TctC
MAGDWTKSLISSLVLLLVFAMLALHLPDARADQISDFFQGKTLQLVIGYDPGGGYDLYARALARHMTDHIPGRPTIIVQNMPGGGSIKAANYLYGVAPKDGTVFGGFSRGVPMDPLFGRTDGVQYDATKFNWIGSISSEVSVCAFRAGAGIASWSDMQTKPFTIGATGVGADSDVFPTVLRNMFHLPLKLVSGYKSAADVVLAMQRGEVDGRCGWSWNSIVSANKALYEANGIVVVAQIALQRLPALKDVPLVTDFADGPDQLTTLKLLISRQSLARPYVLPPGVAPERVAALRDAFDATMTDPQFLTDAQGIGLEVDPMRGADAAALVGDIYATPPADVKNAMRFMTERVQ